MNRRDFVKAVIPAAALTMTPAAKPRPAARDADEESAFWRERCAEQLHYAPEYRLLLPPLWETCYALEEAADHPGPCKSRRCCCEDAAGMRMAMEAFQSGVQCDAAGDAQEEALADKQAAGWDLFHGDPGGRVLAALFDLLGATDDLRERHGDCSCRLCGDAAAARWTVQLFIDVMESTTDPDRARAEAERRGRKREELARRLGLA